MEKTNFNDEFFMRKAIELAKIATGFTSPNPLVGCVIVKDGEIIGQGYHHEAGKSHAEIEAINNAYESGNAAKIPGSCLYVNLEPCSHFGKTPPCANRLVQEKISRVVIAMRDPNELVNGKGVNILREANIEVVESCLESEARWLNRGFVKFHTHGRPWVNLKAASSLDGKLALKNGISKWLSGEKSRVKAHMLRAENDAVLVGVNTVLNDDPELTVRIFADNHEFHNPKRVILDRFLRTPLDAKIINSDGKCVIFCGEFMSKDESEKAQKFRDLGVKVIESCLDTTPPLRNGEIGELILAPILEHLAREEGVMNLLVEGGAKILNSFIRENLADYMYVFFAPKIIGEGLSFGTGLSLRDLSGAKILRDVKSEMFDQDVLIEGRFECSQD